MKQFVRAYLSVALWMIVIFTASSDLGSARNTSRFIGPILRWFNPDVTVETIRAVQAVVRKSAHIAEYAVLALLAWRGRKMITGQWNVWSWKEFWAILAFCVLYAASDEYHQAFVSSRLGSAYDVLFDTAGAACGLLAFHFFQQFRHRDPRRRLETNRVVLG